MLGGFEGLLLAPQAPHLRPAAEQLFYLAARRAPEDVHPPVKLRDAERRPLEPARDGVRLHRLGVADVAPVAEVVPEQEPFVESAEQVAVTVVQSVPHRQGAVELPEEQLCGRHR